MKPVLRLARGLVALLACLLALGCAAGPRLYGLAPTLDARHLPKIRPVMDRASAELSLVVDHVAVEHPSVSLAMTGVHGSWFLPLVELGGDLDVLGVIDLGTLPADGGADAAITRIEAVLRGFRRRGALPRVDTGMAMLQTQGIGEDGRMDRRADALALVERAIAGADGAGTEASYAVGERRVPYHFPPGVVSLTVHPRAKYLSNRFALEPAMATHVREVSIELIFLARTSSGHPLVLQPLYARGAAPIEAWTFIHGVMFDDPVARDRFAAWVLPPGFDLVERSVTYGAHMLEVARTELEGPRPIKAGKRLLQSWLMIEPGFPDEAARFRAELQAWLHGPAAELGDLAAFAGVLADAARAGAEQAFWDGGDLDRVLTGYRVRLRRLSVDLAGALDPLRARLEAVRGAEPDDRVAAWEALEAEARRAAVALGPGRDRLRYWADRLAARYAELGCRRLPVLDVREPLVRMPIAALEPAGLTREHVRWPGRTWRVEWVDHDEAEPLRTLHVRVATTPEQQRAWERVSQALERQAARYAIPPSAR